MSLNAETVRVLIAVAMLLSFGTPALSSEKPGPFDDVPNGHWAYDSSDTVCRLMPSSVCDLPKGKRAVTRYEFAIEAQRMVAQLRQLYREGFRERISLLDKAVAQESPVGAIPVDEIRLAPHLTSAVHSLSEVRNLRTVLKALQRLCTEFSSEFEMLGTKVPPILEEIEVVGAYSKTISQGFDTLAQRNPLPLKPKSK